MQNLLRQNIENTLHKKVTDEQFEALSKLFFSKSYEKKVFLTEEENVNKYIFFVEHGSCYSYRVDQKGEKHAIQFALITGSGSGIGRATALIYAREGAKVVVSDINVEHGNAVVVEIQQQGGEAIFIKADNAIPKDHEALIEQTVKKFGALHIAVNNAGIGGPLASTADYHLRVGRR